MARHVLGVLGVLAAGVLLAVSAAMNYRFGFSLGKTEMDGQIYGMASAAADCFKALVPFFFFAALRNRMWSQALAAALVWGVVSTYSLTSALGHAALNRLDTTGQRAVQTANYKDLRADLERAKEQLGWIPAHRPADTVTAELNVLKAQRQWQLTSECASVSGKSAREFCQQYHKLNAELASGRQSQKQEARISDISARLATTPGGTVLSDADPQASVLARLSGLNVGQVQTALTIFVALLIEIGSGLGMYVAFAYWRIHERKAVPARVPEVVREAGAVAAAAASARTPPPMPVAEAPAAAAPELLARHEEAPATAAAEPPASPRHGANDNRITTPIMPPSDVQRFYRERVVEAAEGSSLTSTELYEDYCRWCEDNDKVPFAHPRVTREIGELGVKKERIGKRTRYFGIALRSETRREEDKKLPQPIPRAA